MTALLEYLNSSNFALETFKQYYSTCMCVYTIICMCICTCFITCTVDPCNCLFGLLVSGRLSYLDWNDCSIKVFLEVSILFFQKYLNVALYVYVWALII